MATKQIGWELWFGCLVLLWSLYPLVFTQARSVMMLSIMTALLALLGWLFRLAVLTTWSGGIGLCNLTLTLLLTGHPPDLWAGLSAGIILFALLDSGQRLPYLRHCWHAPGVGAALLRPFVYLSGATVLVGLSMGTLVVYLRAHTTSLAMPGILTVLGACLLAGLIALFLLYTNRLSNT